MTDNDTRMLKHKCLCSYHLDQTNNCLIILYKQREKSTLIRLSKYSIHRGYYL